VDLVSPVGVNLYSYIPIIMCRFYFIQSTMIYVSNVKPKKSLTKVSDERSWGHLFRIRHFNT